MDLSDWKQWFFLPLLPIVIPLDKRRIASSRKATTQYLANVSPTSCLLDLNRELGSLLSGVDHVNKIFEKFATASNGGTLFWKKNNFARYLDASQPGNKTLKDCIPLLWRMFCFCSHYPFPASIAAQGEGFEAGGAGIDLNGFRRAFAFLVLRGVELYGAKHNGDAINGLGWETGDKHNFPRSARMIFRALSNPSLDPATQPQAAQHPLRVQDVKDTIYFTQPVVYVSLCYGPHVEDVHFETAANRLLRASDEQSAVQDSGWTMLSKADLQSFIRLTLLVRVEDKCWKEGINQGEYSQRTGDIQYSHLVPNSEEASRASDIASAFVASQFPGSQSSIPWDSFQTLCSDRPSFIFSFFQLWASIFAPKHMNTPCVQQSSSLPVSIVNLFCLQKVAHYTASHSKCRFYEDELKFNLDLQDSRLVVDLDTKPDLDETELYKTITAKDWFHILLIHGEDLESQDPIEEKKSKHIAAFLTPPEFLDKSNNMMWSHEMYSTDLHSRSRYSWQCSALQLQPNATITNNRGMSPYVVSGVLELRSPETANEQITHIKLDLQKRLVDITGLMARPKKNPTQATRNDEKAPATPEDMSTWSMRLVDLKTYRMPGTSSRIGQEFEQFLVSIGKITSEQRRLGDYDKSILH